MNFFRKIIFPFTKKGMEKERVCTIQQICKHEHWNCDKQIRVIECKNCGLRAWIDDYVDLYFN